MGLGPPRCRPLSRREDPAWRFDGWAPLESSAQVRFSTHDPPHRDRSYRTEVLNAHLFESIAELQANHIPAGPTRSHVGEPVGPFVVRWCLRQQAWHVGRATCRWRRRAASACSCLDRGCRTRRLLSGPRPCAPRSSSRRPSTPLRILPRLSWLTETIHPCTPQGAFGARRWHPRSTSARHRIRHGIRHTAARAGRRSCPPVANGRLRHMLIAYARVSKPTAPTAPRRNRSSRR